MSKSEPSVQAETVDSLTPRSYIGRELQAAIAGRYGIEIPTDEIYLETPVNPEHGDFATNLAMRLAKQLKQPPRVIAETIVDALAFDSNRVRDVEIAGPGFVNFRLGTRWLAETLIDIETADTQYGASNIGAGQRVQVEFVSANPTGPLSIGHARQAVIGDALSRLLERCGYEVTREYYFNNAGRQMLMLAKSVYARYMESLGRDYPFPEDGYRGDYIRDIAQEIRAAHGDALAGAPEKDGFRLFKETAERLMFDQIKHSLRRLDIEFDVYYNESSLYDNGRIQGVIDGLTERGYTYEKDGALWFKATEFGLPKDPVIVKSGSGEPTYRLPDIAYHQHKFERGFDLIIDIFGSDHDMTHKQVTAGLEALGLDTNRLKVLIHQFVTLIKDGEQVKMSTRAANFVTLDELLDEVGPDVTRFFILMRSMNSHLNFDLNLAAEQSDENPVYYVQYAHARTVNILRHAEEQSIEPQPARAVDLSLLSVPEEIALIKLLGRLPEVIQNAASACEPHRVTGYIRDVAAAFHLFYHRCRVVADDKALTHSRLALVNATRIVLRNSLNVLGVSAPDHM